MLREEMSTRSMLDFAEGRLIESQFVCPQGCTWRVIRGFILPMTTGHSYSFKTLINYKKLKIFFSWGVYDNLCSEAWRDKIDNFPTADKILNISGPNQNITCILQLQWNTAVHKRGLALALKLVGAQVSTHYSQRWDSSVGTTLPSPGTNINTNTGN